MDTTLKLFTYIDGVNDTPFPNKEEQIQFSAFEYNANRMGASPTITAKAKRFQCLDDMWNGDVYAIFEGERYFIRSTPSSLKNSDDERFEHDIILSADREKLNNIYFIDAVQGNTEIDKTKTNTTKVIFMGDVNEFAARLTASFAYSKLPYKVVVDKGISSENKLVSFEKKYMSEALQEIYNIFQLPYYFKGATIHVGYTEDAIPNVFRYGANDALLSISKNNANYRIVNRCTGTGSSDNIPYYYPNKSAKGDVRAITNADNKTLKQSNLRITDIVKFSEKMALNEKAEWKYVKSNSCVELVDVKEQGRNGWESVKDKGFLVILNKSSSGLVWEGSKTLQVTYKVNKSSDLSFSFNHIGLEGQMITISSTNSMVEGKFEPTEKTITLKFTYAKVVSITDGNGSLRYKVHLDLSIFKQNEKSWAIGDKKINLSDYGVEIVGLDFHDIAIGDSFSQELGKIIPSTNVLMPPIYRNTNGEESFYNAKNNTYNKEDGGFYIFENEYDPKNPKEIVVDFPEIKPTIEGMTNGSGQRMDKFIDFAWDANDNDETDAEGNYLHPYFFAKLPIYNGENGFNLFSHASEQGNMQISMTSGVCGACVFEIGVGEDTQKNLVQVDTSGNLKRDKGGNVLWKNQKPQERQNDTQNYEVWIALKKDDQTYGDILPSIKKGLKPTTDDTFVILNINLPDVYIYNAEKKLEDAIIKYMSENNLEKFNFEIGFSRIYLAEHPEVLAMLNENSRIIIEYNNKQHTLYVDNFSYKMDGNNSLPDIEVSLTDTLSVGQSSLKNAITEVTNDILNKNQQDVLGKGNRYFLRKDVKDAAKEKITFEDGFETRGTSSYGESVDSFLSGKGTIITDNGRIQTDRLEVRDSLSVMDLIVNQIQGMESDYSFTPTGKIENVEDLGENTYRLKIEKKADFDFIKFEGGDICFSIINNLLSGGKDYYTSWMRVISNNRQENTMTVVLYPDSEVAGGRNYPPIKGFNITRRGNVFLEDNENVINDRTKSWLLSSREGRILFLNNVYKPILEDYNYALSIGRFPNVKALENLPINQNDLGILAKTIVCENLYQYDYNGDIISKKVDRGEWLLAIAQSEQPYRFIQHEATYPDGVHTYTELEQHTVYHYGCKWGCLVDKTTDEPRWNSPSWSLLEGDKNYTLSFESSNGWQFFLNQVNTEISAIVSYGNRDISNVLFATEGVEIEWLRDTGNIPSDNSWKPTYVDGKKNVIKLTTSDMGSGWGQEYRKISFICKVFIPVGNELQKVENKINIKL